jgi:hypothetical protein
MNPILSHAARTSGRLATLLVAAAVGAACGTTGSTLRVTTAPAGRLGEYASVQIVCSAEDEKERGKEYTGRLETQLLVRMKERETFREYKLSTDEGSAELTLKVIILDMKKAGGYGWYGRSSSKVSCDATLLDTKSKAVVAAISVVARPKHSNVEAALEDAATQIADYLREKR